jgi:hypothetical protein
VAKNTSLNYVVVAWSSCLIITLKLQVTSPSFISQVPSSYQKFISLVPLFVKGQDRSQSYFRTDGQSLSMSWCRAHSGTCDQIKVLSYFTTDSQYVLVSSTLVGLATRYYFLSQCFCPKFAVLFLWGALSDERMGLQFAV